MKKKWIILATAIALAIICVFTSCENTKDKEETKVNTESNITDAEYYGAPSSNKVKKLLLNKKTFKR